MYYYYDSFCNMYWNRVTWQWQVYKTSECYYKTKAEAISDNECMYPSDDVKLKYLLDGLALAA